ncbi:MAG: DNA gyrase/topoisomerase IV subunit A [Clostridium sp.]|nr:DNA gyrase/topoisomerase IV subunit A [Bacteroidales bacterium]MCM1511207.1 DNA gyrase/topoisomerase IV subunit A [Clostridium sp.]
MSDEIQELESAAECQQETNYKPANRFDASIVHHLSGMYQNWFIDYASYVILERAVPHIEDGLKPVQRRILHSMKRMDDGRYNKVANIVGHTMQFHPHGDASIGDALVQIGQKNLLIDCQGNWGNILTGSRAAAPRYIEARLSKFALETVFNQKTTEWQMSYDGRNKEPVTLPVKFPLLLAQGAEGIAVGLSSKILPHNFNELCDAAVSYLRGEEYHLYPDFPTGGSIDVSKYNDGQRGGRVRVRARIEKLDNKTLVIRDIPYSKTSETLIASITSAIEKGKIKARKVEDLTAAQVEILVHLAPGISSDKTIDALYAFSDCEVSISPNCCVIEDNKPVFATVSDVLNYNAEQTKELIRKELEIRRGELLEQLFYASLEKIFIEERIYKDRKYENAANLDAACEHIDDRLTPFYSQLVREVTKDDIIRLMEIKMKRILKFNKDKADELMASIKAEIAEIDRDLGNLTEVACNWFMYLKGKYGADYPRLTEIRSFENIDAVRVLEANEKLYINRQEGFIGTGMKKDEFVCNCSNLDDIIIFYKDGKYKIVRVQEKMFIGKNVLHVQVQKKNDTRTIYNVVYRDGKRGCYFAKRFHVASFTRDSEYDLTKGTAGSKVVYFTANPNGEAEVIKVTLEPGVKVKKLFMEYDFGTLAVKNRNAGGNILSKTTIHRISLKSRGHSTLDGRDVWFDPDVLRLNYDEHGKYLGKFNDSDSILVVLDNGEVYITNFDLNNHYEQNILVIEKLDTAKTWTLLFHNGEQQGQVYMKRFRMDLATKKHQSMLGSENSSVALLTDTPYPRVRVNFKNNDTIQRESLEIECETFIDVKVAGFKAKGKRVAIWPVAGVEELEPARLPEPEEKKDDAEDIADSGNDGAGGHEGTLDPDAGKTEQEVMDEITGQLRLDFDE